MILKAYTQHKRVWTPCSKIKRTLVVCISCLFVPITSAFFSSWGSKPSHICSEHLPQGEQSLVLMADVLLHHHTAAERLLLLPRQTQLLHARVCAGGRAYAPHCWLGQDGKGALCFRLGLLLKAAERVGLLADVQVSLEKVSSGGYGRQRWGVAGWRGTRWGGLEGLLPAVVLHTHRSLLRREGGRGGSVKHGGGSENGGRRRRRWLLLGQKEQGILGRSCLRSFDLRLGLVLDLQHPVKQGQRRSDSHLHDLM